MDTPSSIFNDDGERLDYAIRSIQPDYRYAPGNLIEEMHSPYDATHQILYVGDYVSAQRSGS